MGCTACTEPQCLNKGALYLVLLFCLVIQGVSRLVDITVGGDFLGLCDQRSSYTCVRFWTVTELRPLET
jgi:hypothetical protein